MEVNFTLNLMYLDSAVNCWKISTWARDKPAETSLLALAMSDWDRNGIDNGMLYILGQTIMW